MTAARQQGEVWLRELMDLKTVALPAVA